MKDQFLDILNNIKNTNVSEAPNFRVLKALAVSPEVKYPFPLLVAASIKINVNENFVNDEELFDKTIKIYVSILNDIWYELVKMSSLEAKHRPFTAFFAMVERMSIEYSF